MYMIVILMLRVVNVILEILYCYNNGYDCSLIKFAILRLVSDR